MSSAPQRSADRLGQLGDGVAVGEVERRDRRAAAGVVDPLLDRFQRRRGARDEDDMRAGGGERLGGRGADPAAGAGDERELVRRRAWRRRSWVRGF